MMLAPNLAATAAHFQQDSTIDDLDRAIVSLASRINSESHDLLVPIRRFDERGGWLRWGFSSCADWLHWRCDLSVSAAREKVRVAHALKTLPSIVMAFDKGELSYSKVRALTRVEDYGSEDALLTFALHTTAARVEERCRELRCGTEASIDDAVQGGFRIEKDYRDRGFFERPDGRAVPFCGYRAEDMTDDQVDNITGEYLQLDTSAEGFSNSRPAPRDLCTATLPRKNFRFVAPPRRCLRPE